MSLLARGGSSEVFLAEHPRISRRVAVKLLLPEHCRRPRAIARFLAEARAASEVRHRNVVQIFDCGENGPDGRAYIVMEHLEGTSLRGYLRDRPRPVDVRTAAALMNQVCDGLLAIHAKRLAHRDLKPENIFLAFESASVDPEVVVKVLDFGIARPIDDTDRDFHTRTGALLGTPAYMAPEQARSDALLDLRVDVYALGCVFFEIFCGRAPFLGTGPAELVVAHATEPPPSPSSLGASLPPELERLILQMLFKSAADRPSVSVVARTLDGLAGDDPRTLRASTLGLRDARGASASDPTLGQSAAEHATPSAERAQTDMNLGTSVPLDQRSGRMLRWVAGALVVAVAVGVVVLSGRPRPGTDTGPPQPPIPTNAAVAEHVSITVRSTPIGADVVLDGEQTPRGRTPLDLVLPRAPGRVSIELRLQGHTPAVAALPLDRNGVVQVALNPSERAAVPSSAFAAPSQPSPAKVPRTVRHKAPSKSTHGTFQPIDD